MIKFNKKFIVTLSLVCFVSGPILSTPAEAGFISDALDTVKGAVSSLMDAAKGAVKKLKNGAKSVAGTIKGDAKAVTATIKAHAPAIVGQALDKATGALKALTGDAAKAAKWILAHRDTVENAIIFGLKNGKTIADIGLDVIGLIPGINIGTEAISIVLDVILPPLTTAAQLAFDADQNVIMGK